MSIPSASRPPRLETLMTRGVLLLESKGKNACVTSSGPRVLVWKVLVTISE